MLAVLFKTIKITVIIFGVAEMKNFAASEASTIIFHHIFIIFYYIIIMLCVRSTAVFFALTGCFIYRSPAVQPLNGCLKIIKNYKVLNNR